MVLVLCPAKPDSVWLWHYALQNQLVEGPVVSFFSPLIALVLTFFLVCYNVTIFSFRLITLNMEAASTAEPLLPLCLSAEVS